MSQTPAYAPTAHEVQLQLGGQQRTVAFTMGALLEAVGLLGGDLQLAIDRLSAGNPDAMTPLVYAGLKTRARKNALPADFSLEDCREWWAEVLFTRPAEVAPLLTAMTACFAELGNRMGSPTPEAAAPEAKAPTSSPTPHLR